MQQIPEFVALAIPETRMKGCRPFSDAEVSQILENLTNPRDKAFFLLGVKAGYRVSELLSIRVSDVLKDGRFVDEIEVTRQYMKGKQESRRVPLHGEAKAALESWTTTGTLRELFVFQSREGENTAMTRSQAWRIIKSACRKVGIRGKIGTHSMRKTFAKNVYENTGFDLIATQEALGHRDIATTIRYLAFDKDKVRNAILKS